MADDNKPLRYLRYAIGEILLVVIGILIALSINNWNQEKQSRVKEIEMLKDFQKGLKYDILQMDSIFLHYDRAKVSLNKVLYHLEENLAYSDSLDFHFFNTTLIYDSGGLTDGVYETLKSSGFDLISNKDIRDLIISVYDEHNPWMNDWEKRYINLIFDAQKDIYNTRFMDFWNGDNKDLSVIGVMKPIDYEALKNDNEYKHLLRTQVHLIGWLIEKPVRNTQNESRKLLKLIESELKN